MEVVECEHLGQQVGFPVEVVEDTLVTSNSSSDEWLQTLSHCDALIRHVNYTRRLQCAGWLCSPSMLVEDGLVTTSSSLREE
ncbi:hypothetical protein GOP47_0010659 [Adiantum capillus-veneris]|uniref:Uncharacterized protein n=1 Tax=Adiantum capillus-veneris TaxID=13818 RepID=A0A9D4UVC6_ADICA|nr:hypothetical protein GOP47_0010659 [Adiantum capillus-veneris]